MSEQKQEPACPACGKAMVLSREIKREDIGAVLRTFECRLCHVFYTIGDDDEAVE